MVVPLKKLVFHAIFEANIKDPISFILRVRQQRTDYIHASTNGSIVFVIVLDLVQNHEISILSDAETLVLLLFEVVDYLFDVP